MSATASRHTSARRRRRQAPLSATVAAMAWANIADASYADVWSYHLTIGWGRFAISEDLLHWVNDGLMTIFFFVVGLEIKRELVRGELRDRRVASLPILAAFGGMAVPAVLYLAVNVGGSGGRGWAIPIATDIAFAVVVLAVLGTRVPKPLKLFLLTLAIVDDIGAIVVIAVFYSEGLAFEWVVGALSVIAAIRCMQRLHVGHPLFYLVPVAVCGSGLGRSQSFWLPLTPFHSRGATFGRSERSPTQTPPRSRLNATDGSARACRDEAKVRVRRAAGAV